MAVLIAKIQGETRAEIAENLMELAQDIENGHDDNCMWDDFYDYDLVEGRLIDIPLSFPDNLKHTKLL